MKPLSLLVLALIIWSQQAITAGASGFSLSSPDHPPIWFNRAGEKVSEELIGAPAKHEMVSYIAYSKVEFTPIRDQTLYDSVSLSFPMVRLDEATSRLYFVGKSDHRITIGHLESGIMGTQVVLNDGIQFSENRRDGVVHGSITSSTDRENR